MRGFFVWARAASATATEVQRVGAIEHRGAQRAKLAGERLAVRLAAAREGRNVIHLQTVERVVQREGRPLPIFPLASNDCCAVASQVCTIEGVSSSRNDMLERIWMIMRLISTCCSRDSNESDMPMVSDDELRSGVCL